ncbi:MAG TPA: beta-ketoacyl-[acyl-carrier-protein] synthase family protein [Euzebya sp.]|nr:beta-ketoacyl-[acyl-carrier-protein] synthase family protein [Euzebya sp.]
MKRVAITGIGAVTPVGNDAETTWQALKAGRSGVGPITTFDASTFDVRIAGMVDNFDVGQYLPDPSYHRHLSRAASFGVGAVAQAMAGAGIDDHAAYAPEEIGISMGGSVGRGELQELADMAFVLDSTGGKEIYRQAPRDVLLRDQNLGVAEMARVIGAAGPTVNVSTACAGSAHAIGEAFRRVQEGDAPVMIAGGFDALTTWLDVMGFMLLGALTTEYNDDPQSASRPFDGKRSGFVLGEGAVAVALEDWDRAVERGATIQGELIGYASTLNAYRITDAPPDGRGVSDSIRLALEDAHMTPADVDYVVAHGTGTHGNDVCETAAIKSVLGDDAYRVAISSPKSMTGHLTSGAGGLNLLAALGALREQIVSPTRNLTSPDPKLDLDFVPNEARPMRVRAAIVNAFAFGGTNGSMVVRHPDPSSLNGAPA